MNVPLLFDPGGTVALGHCRASVLSSAIWTASTLIGLFRRCSRVTASAPRTTYACRAQSRPHVLPVSPLPSSHQRPPCSRTMISKSPPTSSAPTRLRTARFAPRGRTRRTRARSGGPGDFLLRPRICRARCHVSLQAARLFTNDGKKGRIC